MDIYYRAYTTLYNFVTYAVAPVLQKSSLLGRGQQVGVCKIRIEPFWILASKQAAGCTSSTCTTYARICLFGGSLSLHTVRGVYECQQDRNTRLRRLCTTEKLRVIQAVTRFMWVGHSRCWTRTYSDRPMTRVSVPVYNWPR